MSHPENVADAATGAESERYRQGRAKLLEVSGERGAAAMAGLAEVAPDLARYVIEFAFGDVYARPGLTLAQRELATVAALSAQGDTAGQLTVHLNAAVNLGLTPEELVETLIQLVPFAGFPRALNAIRVVREVLAERGLTAAPEVHAEDRDRYQRGAEKLVEIDGQHGLDVVESLGDLAPDLGRYIVEFTFGDVYQRASLTPRQRQLVTVAALTALGDTAPQQRVHIGAALNVGLSPAQVVEILIQVVPYVGFPRVLNAIRVARDVFEERGTSAR